MIAFADRIVSHKSIDPLLKPDTVAILGASGNKNKLGYLLDGGFTGGIYPINPKAEKIEGLRCYAKLADVPIQVDLAIFCVSAVNGVEADILFAAGYSETSGDYAPGHVHCMAKSNGDYFVWNQPVH